MTTKLVEAAKNTFGSGHLDGVFIGVEKIDNNGNMKYTSTGLKTPISPWKESVSDVDQGMDQPYVCLNFGVGGIWHDCADNKYYKLVSVCEF